MKFGRSANSAGAHFERGAFFLNTVRDYQRALADFDIAIKSISDQWYWYKRRGLAHFHLHHYEAALADITEALRQHPDDGSCLYWIPPALVARCPDLAFRDGMLKLADKAVSKAERADNDVDCSYMRRGRADLLATFGHNERALADYRQVVDRNPDRYYKQYQLALLQLGTGNEPAYCQTCQDLLTRFAESEAADELHFIGWTCALAADAVDDYSLALQLAQKAIDADVGNQQYINGLAALQFRDGQSAEALQTFSVVANSEESNSTSSAYTVYFRAMTEWQLDRKEDARKTLQQANESAEAELNDADKTPVWNRKLTLELLGKEAADLIGEEEGGGELAVGSE